MKKYDSIPKAPDALPLLGHAVPLFRDPLSFLTSLPPRGDLVRIGLGPREAIMVCTPQLTRQVLLNDSTFDKGGPFFERAREVIGSGLATSLHSQHRRQRRLVQPAFRPARLTSYGPVMSERIHSVVDSWHDGQIIDVPSEMFALTSRVMLTALFGTALDPVRTAETTRDFSIIISGIHRRMFQPSWLHRLPLSANRRYERANTRLRRTVADLVTEHRARVEAEHRTRTTSGSASSLNGPEDSNLLSLLQAARDTETDGEGLTDAELVDQAMTFFTGGIETTATLLCWAVHLLAQHPDITERLHTEVDSVLAGRPPTHADLPRLVLTGQILAETLRLYPPIWLLTRTATTDTSLAGTAVPQGTTVVFSSYLIHHHPDVYPDAERFDPDRWQNPPGRECYIPFSAGARKCIGDTFALTEATLALAQIAARWRLTHVTGTRVRASAQAVLQPQDLRMQVSVRDVHTQAA